VKPELPSLPGYESIDDVSLHLHVELGNKNVLFEHLVSLTVGSILQLDRPTGENVDLYIGDVLLGSAEILVVETTLAVRIAELRDHVSDSNQLSE
jgi:flagellar motor switch protein FliN/FliY